MKSIYKTLLTFFIGLLITYNTGFAQPILEWSKNFGGGLDDIARNIEKTADGGFIVAGWAESDNGDVSGNNGGQDAWFVKLDNEGNLVWEKNYGGSNDDTINEIKQTTDGGFIATGESESTDGDVGGNNGEEDCWVIKLDNVGNLEWSKNYGGSGRDQGIDIIQTTDNGYAMLSHSDSNNGEVTGNNGLRDYWVVKMDSDGNLQWQDSFGGEAWDTPASIKQAADGGYIVSGFTGSDAGDIIANNGSNDNWLIKLDSEGNLEWQKNHGGSDSDAVYEMELTADGGYVFVGRTLSTDGDLSGNNGEFDAWVFKLDSAGDMVWSKNYGGALNDAANSIKQTVDGKYIVAGDTGSNDGDIGENNGLRDFWLLMLDSDGNLEWSETYGGLTDDVPRDLEQIGTDEFIVVGWTASNDGDVTANNGIRDFWILKFGPMPTSTQTPNNNSKVIISPNPTNNQFTISAKDLNTPVDVRIFDAVGHSVYRKNNVDGPLSIDHLPSGNYAIQILSAEFSITRKLIVL